MAIVKINPEELEQQAAKFDAIIGNIGEVSERVFSNFCRLAGYSGYGLNEIQKRLRAATKGLNKCLDDLIYERAALKKISEYAVNADKEAFGVISGNAINDLKYGMSNDSSESGNHKSVLDILYDWYNRIIGSAADDMDIIDYTDFVDKSISLIEKLTAQPNSFPVWSLIKYGYDISGFYQDVGINNPTWFVDGLSITEETISVNKDIFDIFKNLGYVSEDSKWGKITSSLMWFKIALSTTVKGIESYNEYNADGVLNDKEKWSIAFDTETAALSACISGFLTTIHPAAGAVYSYFDSTFDLSGNLSDAIQGWCDSEVKKMRYTLYNSSEFTEFYYEQNSFVQTLIRFATIDSRYRAIVNYIYQ